MWSEILAVLTRPSSWSSIEELKPHQRIVLALAVLAVTLVVAALAAFVTGRWGRARAATEATRGRAKRLKRAAVLLILAVGGYLAVEAAPLGPRSERVLAGALFVIGALVVAQLVTHLATLLITASMLHAPADDRARFEREYLPLVTKVTWLIVGLILVAVVANHFGQNITSLVAALGVGSLAIGLAAQQTLGNMIAGFVLLVDRPFRAGDRIQVATGETGEVVEVGVRATRILLPERNLLIVPNADLVSSRVINFAFPTASVRGEVKVGVAYGTDLERASAVLTAIIAEDPRARAESVLVRVTTLADSSIEVTLSFEVIAHSDVGAVQDRARRELLRRFAAENIDVPFPRTDVKLLEKA